MSSVRVRFAPSPTGAMHLGNVRIALMNYLFAKQKNGTFVLRIEDTDFSRAVEGATAQIIEDLSWLGIAYDEGPEKISKYGPYFQSQRADLYSAHLETLKQRNLVYRCFCSPEALEAQRKRQAALKQPPRYSRICKDLSAEEIDTKLAASVPFIWRFILDEAKTVTFTDLAHKTMSFGLKHFSDIPLTRQDGSFTFMFANFVDDHEMAISHVIRGEDHLANTAGQVALYEAFYQKPPVYWHLPIIGNSEGKKLSKRDFGFSLQDLKNGGYLPEAIANYLTIIGGSFTQEIMDMAELINAIDYDALPTTGMIRYDQQKLTWVNHQWLLKQTPAAIAQQCRPYLESVYPEAQKLNAEELERIVTPIAQELTTLASSVEHLRFYFERPVINPSTFSSTEYDVLKPVLQQLKAALAPKWNHPDTLIEIIKKHTKSAQVKNAPVFKYIRIALTGKPVGPGIKEIVEILGPVESRNRFEVAL